MIINYIFMAYMSAYESLNWILSNLDLVIVDFAQIQEIKHLDPSKNDESNIKLYKNGKINICINDSKQ